jgi:hypothetical protein
LGYHVPAGDGRQAGLGVDVLGASASYPCRHGSKKDPDRLNPVGYRWLLCDRFQIVLDSAYV